ncbi:uncharacterized protein LOC118740529 isoform X4 [Rhagoletis pomonella]|uniref:uncharacterized protein LOC118740529 isoform X4 n=1 Tax=Rhagoletis pomonella TaxID=28610 RepID=UPI001783DDCB|nr:uncharacterized protein LOC118740529 isoform X4 [Rhagoletis pomonella]
MGLSRGFVVPLWHLACICFIIQTAITVQAQTQQKRSSRITSSRSFGTNVKASASNGVNFDCPEEFGYYPHPSDCTQYYVCVFGGALLESCTGGLMYSHELQTCDWPRNVGCEVVDNSAASLGSTGSGSGTRSGKQQQQQQSINSQHVPSRIRFGSAFSSPAGTTQSPKATVPPQYHRQPPQVIQAQVQSLPQHAGTVIGTRGQPKPFDTQEDIAKLYADAHETLPPVEEEESDRQQRVYRGQPSTVSQVQRDRDGIIHQASINAIPNHGKIGSYAFGSQFRPESSSPSSPQSQLAPSHYAQQQQQQQRPPTGVIVEAIPSTSIQNPNRNYYNTTALLNHAGYESQANIHHQQQHHHQLHETQQQADEQQQLVGLHNQHAQQQQQQHQQHQQQQQQAPQQSNQEQSSYEQYYSVYDDDLDLYRDIEYQQQQQQQQQQQPPPQQQYQPPPQQQYQPPPPQQQQQSVRQQPVQQSTYRPLEILTTPAPRETYKPQEKPTYNNNQQSLIYNTDYDEDLIAQIEQDNVYDQPTRPPLRTNSNNNRNRGSSSYTGQDRDVPTAVTSNRGTHPPRTRPTLKPSGTIVSKAQEFVDIYRNPPTRPEPLYPQPTPDKTAAKCRKDVCLLPDCSCGGKEIPGDLPVETVPQIVLITFDDSVNDLNKQLYIDLFEKGRVNPNGCPITATFYVSHEWTDYSQVQNLYADGHEMASHTVSHSFGEQFSQKKWTREIAGQREILAAYGGVKLSDVRGMRAPFLSVGGNKMYKMLYDSNFTYDSSLPVYENRPPSWPYTFDYKIFHDCMIPPCPTRSYPGVWQVPMVMWQDLNGGRCSMGDACSNPSESDGVYKMIMKNFERHYTTNRAPFGLYYHAAWFTQPHHKEGFIKFLDAINQMPDVWIVTNWQMLQWVRDPTPLSRINSFQPFSCDYSDRPKRCNNPKVCNLWHKSGVRYMKTCQPCPDIYPWTGKSGIRSSRIDNEIEDSTA